MKASLVLQMLEQLGEDPRRDGLKDTPARVSAAWQEWTSGYDVDVKQLLTTFLNDSGYDEMITVRGIPFYSHCEHHLAPFFGTADVSYIPHRERIVGLSKLSRVVDAYAKRLQVQERMTRQIATAIKQHMKPQGVGVRIVARHMCMESRGIAQQGHETVTTALFGLYRDDPSVRSEFFNSL